MDGAPGSGYPFPVKLDGFIVCLAGFPKVQGQSPKAGSSLRSEWKKEKQRKRLDINGATTATKGKCRLPSMAAAHYTRCDGAIIIPKVAGQFVFQRKRRSIACVRCLANKASMGKSLTHAQGRFRAAVVRLLFGVCC
jgi:hypothetical protein